MKKIYTTAGMNGYPKALREAYVDFENYAEAEAFAEKNNGEVCMLYQRDGWQFWENRGRAYEPMTITPEDYGDDYMMYYNAEDWNAECAEFISMLEYDEATEEEIAAAKERHAKIAEKVAALKENEAVVLYCGEYYKTAQVEGVMKFYEDVHTYEIGVVLNDDEEE